jgi:hypothetical protein
MPSFAETLISLTPHDRREVENFQRFLRVAGKPGERSVWAFPGWLPYVLGAFLELRGGAPAPPPGYDYVPFTAWTFPN